MFDITVKVDRALLKMGKLPDSIRNSLKAEMNILVTAVRDKARSNAATFFHVRTGAYQKSIKKSVRSSQTKVTGKVFSKSRIAHMLETGVRPHDIRAKNAKALAFLGGTFAIEVHHPGLQGHSVIGAAFMEMKSQIYDGLGEAVKDGIKAE